MNWWPGAESKNRPHPVSTLTLANLPFLPGTPLGTPNWSTETGRFSASNQRHSTSASALSHLRRVAPRASVLGRRPEQHGDRIWLRSTDESSAAPSSCRSAPGAHRVWSAVRPTRLLVANEVCGVGGHASPLSRASRYRKPISCHTLLDESLAC